MDVNDGELKDYYSSSSALSAANKAFHASCYLRCRNAVQYELSSIASMFSDYTGDSVSGRPIFQRILKDEIKKYDSSF